MQQNNSLLCRIKRGSLFQLLDLLTDDYNTPQPYLNRDLLHNVEKILKDSLQGDDYCTIPINSNLSVSLSFFLSQMHCPTPMEAAIVAYDECVTTLNNYLKESINGEIPKMIPQTPFTKCSVDKIHKNNVKIKTLTFYSKEFTTADIDSGKNMKIFNYKLISEIVPDNENTLQFTIKLTSEWKGQPIILRAKTIGARNHLVELFQSFYNMRSLIDNNDHIPPYEYEISYITSKIFQQDRIKDQAQLRIDRAKLLLDQGDFRLSVYDCNEICSNIDDLPKKIVADSFECRCRAYIEFSNLLLNQHDLLLKYTDEKADIPESKYYGLLPELSLNFCKMALSDLYSRKLLSEGIFGVSAISYSSLQSELSQKIPELLHRLDDKNTHPDLKLNDPPPVITNYNRHKDIVANRSSKKVQKPYIKLGPIEINSLLKLSQTEIHLGNNKIQSLGNCLQRFAQLQFLDLNDNYIGIIDCDSFTCCPLLETLQIENNGTTSFESVFDLPNLRYLYLGSNRFTSLNHILEALKNIKGNLIKLRLSGNPFIEHLISHSDLTMLNMEYRYILIGKEMPQLQELDMTRITIADRDESTFFLLFDKPIQVSLLGFTSDISLWLPISQSFAAISSNTIYHKPLIYLNVIRIGKKFLVYSSSIEVRRNIILSFHQLILGPCSDYVKILLLEQSVLKAIGICFHDIYNNDFQLCFEILHFITDLVFIDHKHIIFGFNFNMNDFMSHKFLEDFRSSSENKLIYILIKLLSHDYVTKKCIKNDGLEEKELLILPQEKKTSDYLYASLSRHVLALLSLLLRRNNDEYMDSIEEDRSLFVKYKGSEDLLNVLSHEHTIQTTMQICLLINAMPDIDDKWKITLGSNIGLNALITDLLSLLSNPGVTSHTQIIVYILGMIYRLIENNEDNSTNLLNLKNYNNTKYAFSEIMSLLPHPLYGIASIRILEAISKFDGLRSILLSRFLYLPQIFDVINFPSYPKLDYFLLPDNITRFPPPKTDKHSLEILIMHAISTITSSSDGVMTIYNSGKSIQILNEIAGIVQYSKIANVALDIFISLLKYDKSNHLFHGIIVQTKKILPILTDIMNSDDINLISTSINFLYAIANKNLDDNIISILISNEILNSIYTVLERFHKTDEAKDSILYSVNLLNKLIFYDPKLYIKIFPERQYIDLLAKSLYYSTSYVTESCLNIIYFLIKKCNVDISFWSGIKVIYAILHSLSKLIMKINDESEKKDISPKYIESKNRISELSAKILLIFLNQKDSKIYQDEICEYIQVLLEAIDIFTTNNKFISVLYASVKDNNDIRKKSSDMIKKDVFIKVLTTDNYPNDDQSAVFICEACSKLKINITSLPDLAVERLIGLTRFSLSRIEAAKFFLEYMKDEKSLELIINKGSFFFPHILEFISSVHFNERFWGLKLLSYLCKSSQKLIDIFISQNGLSYFAKCASRMLLPDVSINSNNIISPQIMLFDLIKHIFENQGDISITTFSDVDGIDSILSLLKESSELIQVIENNSKLFELAPHFILPEEFGIENSDNIYKYDEEFYTNYDNVNDEKLAAQQLSKQAILYTPKLMELLDYICSHGSVQDNNNMLEQGAFIKFHTYVNIDTSNLEPQTQSYFFQLKICSLEIVRKLSRCSDSFKPSFRTVGFPTIVYNIVNEYHSQLLNILEDSSRNFDKFLLILCLNLMKELCSEENIRSDFVNYGGISLLVNMIDISSLSPTLKNVLILLIGAMVHNSKTAINSLYDLKGPQKIFDIIKECGIESRESAPSVLLHQLILEDGDRTIKILLELDAIKLLIPSVPTAEIFLDIGKESQAISREELDRRLERLGFSSKNLNETEIDSEEKIEKDLFIPCRETQRLLMVLLQHPTGLNSLIVMLESTLDKIKQHGGLSDDDNLFVSRAMVALNLYLANSLSSIQLEKDNPIYNDAKLMLSRTLTLLLSIIESVPKIPIASEKVQEVALTSIIIATRTRNICEMFAEINGSTVILMVFRYFCSLKPQIQHESKTNTMTLQAPNLSGSIYGRRSSISVPSEQKSHLETMATVLLGIIYNMLQFTSEMPKALIALNPVQDLIHIASIFPSSRGEALECIVFLIKNKDNSEDVIINNGDVEKVLQYNRTYDDDLSILESIWTTLLFFSNTAEFRELILKRIKFEELLACFRLSGRSSLHFAVINMLLNLMKHSNEQRSKLLELKDQLFPLFASKLIESKSIGILDLICQMLKELAPLENSAQKMAELDFHIILCDLLYVYKKIPQDDSFNLCIHAISCICSIVENINKIDFSPKFDVIVRLMTSNHVELGASAVNCVRILAIKGLNDNLITLGSHIQILNVLGRIQSNESKIHDNTYLKHKISTLKTLFSIMNTKKRFAYNDTKDIDFNPLLQCLSSSNTELLISTLDALKLLVSFPIPQRALYNALYLNRLSDLLANGQDQVLNITLHVLLEALHTQPSISTDIIEFIHNILPLLDYCDEEIVFNTIRVIGILSADDKSVCEKLTSSEYFHRIIDRFNDYQTSSQIIIAMLRLFNNMLNSKCNIDEDKIYTLAKSLKLLFTARKNDHMLIISLLRILKSICSEIDPKYLRSINITEILINILPSYNKISIDRYISSTISDWGQFDKFEDSSQIDSTDINEQKRVSPLTIQIPEEESPVMTNFIQSYSYLKERSLPLLVSPMQEGAYRKNLVITDLTFVDIPSQRMSRPYYVVNIEENDIYIAILELMRAICLDPLSSDEFLSTNMLYKLSSLLVYSNSQDICNLTLNILGDTVLDTPPTKTSFIESQNGFYTAITCYLNRSPNINGICLALNLLTTLIPSPNCLSILQNIHLVDVIMNYLLSKNQNVLICSLKLLAKMTIKSTQISIDFRELDGFKHIMTLISAAHDIDILLILFQLTRNVICNTLHAKLLFEMGLFDIANTIMVYIIHKLKLIGLESIEDKIEMNESDIEPKTYIINRIEEKVDENLDENADENTDKIDENESIEFDNIVFEDKMNNEDKKEIEKEVPFNRELYSSHSPILEVLMEIFTSMLDYYPEGAKDLAIPIIHNVCIIMHNFDAYLILESKSAQFISAIANSHPDDNITDNNTLVKILVHLIKICPFDATNIRISLFKALVCIFKANSRHINRFLSTDGLYLMASRIKNWTFAEQSIVVQIIAYISSIEHISKSIPKDHIVMVLYNLFNKTDNDITIRSFALQSLANMLLFDQDVALMLYNLKAIPSLASSILSNIFDIQQHSIYILTLMALNPLCRTEIHNYDTLNMLIRILNTEIEFPRLVGVNDQIKKYEKPVDVDSVEKKTEFIQDIEYEVEDDEITPEIIEREKFEEESVPPEKELTPYPIEFKVFDIIDKSILEKMKLMAISATAITRLAAETDEQDLFRSLNGMDALIKLLEKTIIYKVPAWLALNYVHALAVLLFENYNNQDILEKCNGIRLILALLRKKQILTKRKSCLALASACQNSQNRQQFLKYGGVKTILRCIFSKDESLQINSVLVASTIAEDPKIRGEMLVLPFVIAILPLFTVTNEALTVSTTSLLHKLIEDHPENSHAALNNGVVERITTVLFRFYSTPGLCERIRESISSIVSMLFITDKDTFIGEIERCKGLRALLQLMAHINDDYRKIVPIIDEIITINPNLQRELIDIESVQIITRALAVNSEPVQLHALRILTNLLKLDRKHVKRAFLRTRQDPTHPNTNKLLIRHTSRIGIPPSPSNYFMMSASLRGGLTPEFLRDAHEVFDYEDELYVNGADYVARVLTRCSIEEKGPMAEVAPLCALLIHSIAEIKAVKDVCGKRGALFPLLQLSRHSDNTVKRHCFEAITMLCTDHEKNKELLRQHEAISYLSAYLAQSDLHPAIKRLALSTSLEIGFQSNSKPFFQHLSDILELKENEEKSAEEMEKKALEDQAERKMHIERTERLTNENVELNGQISALKDALVRLNQEKDKGGKEVTELKLKVKEFEDKQKIDEDNHKREISYLQSQNTLMQDRVFQLKAASEEKTHMNELLRWMKAIGNSMGINPNYSPMSQPNQVRQPQQPQQPQQHPQFYQVQRASSQISHGEQKSPNIMGGALSMRPTPRFIQPVDSPVQQVKRHQSHKEGDPFADPGNLNKRNR